MPNWCENKIEISGKGVSKIKDALKKIKPKDRDKHIIFKTLVGIPPGTDLKEYERGGWYDTNLAYWGTKWDISYNDSLIHFGKNCITISFLSAWSPPINFGKLLSEIYDVDVLLQYSEPGLDYAGETEIKKGKILRENDYTYDEGIKILGWHDE